MTRTRYFRLKQWKRSSTKRCWLYSVAEYKSSHLKGMSSSSISHSHMVLPSRGRFSNVFYSPSESSVPQQYNATSSHTSRCLDRPRRSSQHPRQWGQLPISQNLSFLGGYWAIFCILCVFVSYKMNQWQDPSVPQPEAFLPGLIPVVLAERLRPRVVDDAWCSRRWLGVCGHSDELWRAIRRIKQT